jgi:capsular exopolysaccharide synthesis family protein
MSTHEVRTLRPDSYIAKDAATGDGFQLPDVRRIISILRRRWLPAALLGSVVFLIVVLGLSTRPPIYAASANILADARGQQDVTTAPSTTQLPSIADSNAVDTDVQILSSRSLAAQVIDHLNLKADDEFLPSKARKPGLAATLHNLKSLIMPPTAFVSADEVAIDALLKHVTVRRSGLTYVITVTARSKDPQKAAAIANAFANGFIIQQMRGQESEAHNLNQAINPRLEEMSREVQAADAAVQKFKNDHDLLSANGATMAEQEASSLNEQIASAQADFAEKTALLNAARDQVRRGGGGADVSAALNSDTIRALRAQQADTSRQLAQLSTQYGDRYPDVVKARSQLHDIDVQIQNEINRILSSLVADAQVSGQRVASLQASLGKAHSTLSSNNGAQVGLLELQRRADASHAIYDAYLSTSKTTSAQEGVLRPDARVISPARASAKPVWPNLPIIVLLALALALFSAMCLIGALEWLNDGIETESDIQSRVGWVSAGTIPTLASASKRGKGAENPQTYIPLHPISAFAEAFRSLKTFIMLPADKAAAPRVVVITSALPHEGKSTTALCLAQTFHLAGKRVLLVDCDLRRRGVSNLIAASGLGVAEVLQGKVSLRDAVVQDPSSGTWVLPAGDPRASPPDVFTPEAVAKFLAVLLANFDVVLLDTAPVLAIADTRLLASKADTTLMVAQWRKTPTPACEQAIKLLVQAGANVAGVALTRVNLNQQVRSGYGDRDYYFNAVKTYYAE